ncbi:hypothetical protein ACJ41O_013097 [Fusarium nematophilum]
MENYTEYLDVSTEPSKGILRGSSPLLLFLIVPIGTISLWIVVAYLTSPLRKYPGPLLAKFTRLWYLYQASTGDSHLVLDNLHRKYGPIVRITPSIIDVDIPDLIKVIFNTKSDCAGIGIFEPHMDKVINQLCRELESRFMDGDNAAKVCDLGRWILFYTWDVVGAVTFSQPIGYLEKGFDFDGTLRNADKAQDYFTVVGTMPFLDRVFDKNPLFRMGPPGFNTVAAISIQHLVDRYQGNDRDYHDPETPDFLDKFIEAKNGNPESVPDAQIISWLMVNMIAGADTTAITIRSALYFSLKHPLVWKRLEEEVFEAGFQGRTPPSYKEVKGLSYVDAVVREALRMLPGVAMSMERYVPHGGFALPNGDYLPQGTIVGMSPYILARNKSVYGDDADEFRPERWLRDEENGESQEGFHKRLLLMNQTDLSFGGGSRICIGKHMGLYQTYKVLATLVTLYEIELADPKKEWKVTNSWFPRQEGLEVRIRRRAR